MSRHHLIVGGGMAGHAAAAAIREAEPDARITLLSSEPDPPYARPPLSKGLWLGKPEESVWLPEVTGLARLGGRRAVALDPVRREVRDDAGAVHRYDRLLLATGGVPRRLASGGERVVHFRTLADYRRLREVAGRRFVVIGGGFIGSELAAALSTAGKEVTLVFPERALGARTYPAPLADHLTQLFRDRGVRVLAGDAVTAVSEGDGPRPGAEGDAARDAVESGGATIVRTRSGAILVADAVVAGLGIAPDVALAAAAGIRCDDGIVVDERLETSASGVFAAGDVARFPMGGGALTRVEHEDAAVTTGRTAGRNMAGAGERYDHVPFFYSDLFDLGYEAVGRLDARLETVASWKVPFREGVVAYLDAGRVCGVLLWGIFGQVDAARALLGRTAPASRTDLTSAILP